MRTNVHGNSCDVRSKLQTGNAHGRRCPILLRTGISKNISFGPLKASSDGHKRKFAPTCAKLLSDDPKGTLSQKKVRSILRTKTAEKRHNAHDMCGKPDVRKGPKSRDLDQTYNRISRSPNATLDLSYAVPIWQFDPSASFGYAWLSQKLRLQPFSFHLRTREKQTETVYYLRLLSGPPWPF
jgi:hypothetical protein